MSTVTDDLHVELDAAVRRVATALRRQGATTERADGLATEALLQHLVGLEIDDVL